MMRRLLLTIPVLAMIAGLAFTPPEAHAASWPIVREGDRGQTVRTLQYLLRQHGISVGVDGTFGPQTEAGVKRFQSSRRLAVDGVVGPQTWSALIVTVRNGSRGEAVKAVQSQLRARVDGIFGPETERTVRAFQSSQRIAVDGVVGPRTWQELIASGGSGGGGGGAGEIPAQFLPFFQQAASRTCGVPWQLLAAIAKVESDFNKNTGPSSAGARGMMQFLPSTYAAYAGRVDRLTGKGLGANGINDPESSVYAAALYLCDEGAPGNLHDALFAYNHAEWYVDKVLAQARAYGMR